MTGIDDNFISLCEGGRKKQGYVPAAATSKSGVTIATGFDLGARSRSDLVALGFPAALIATLEKYCGKKSTEAESFLKKNPLTVTEAEAATIDRISKQQAKALIVSRYNHAVQVTPGAPRFEQLPGEAQTVIASLAFQYGDLAKRCPRVWGFVTNRQWKATVNELRDFGDAYSTRRKKEADLLSRIVAGAVAIKPTVVAVVPQPAAPTQHSKLTGSVGKGGRNLDADVKLVQALLNLRTHSSLKIDGVIGPQTIAAITGFQRKNVGYSSPDGLVEVGGKTWQVLVGQPASAHAIEHSTAPLQTSVHATTPTKPQASSATSALPATNGGEILVSRAGKRVPHYSQGDSRWGASTLGNKKTIKQAGCAISSISMILSYYGRDVTPAIMDGYLDKNHGYSGDSVNWDVAFKCGEEKNGVKFSGRKIVSGGFDAVLDVRIAANKPTLARVDYGKDSDSTYNHFIVIVGRTKDGFHIMNDPATREGDGASNPTSENIVERTTRSKGYRIVSLDVFDTLG